MEYISATFPGNAGRGERLTAFPCPASERDGRASFDSLSVYSMTWWTDGTEAMSNDSGICQARETAKKSSRLNIFKRQNDTTDVLTDRTYNSNSAYVIMGASTCGSTITVLCHSILTTYTTTEEYCDSMIRSSTPRYHPL